MTFTVKQTKSGIEAVVEKPDEWSESGTLCKVPRYDEFREEGEDLELLKNKTVVAARPLIDRNAPNVIETATFGLG